MFFGEKWFSKVIVPKNQNIGVIANSGRSRREFFLKKVALQ